MSRYIIDFDKTINRLVPYYMGGRKLILLLQAILSPMRELNDSFSAWATEKRIEASMTSQTFKLEWYLNRKFKSYFSVAGSKITISNNNSLGNPMYSVLDEVAESEQFVLTYLSEGAATEQLYYFVEESSVYDCSFVVHCPAINTSVISQSEFDSILKKTINKYKISGKTYKITYQ